MKNLDKNKRQIVIMVITLIILILTLLGILLYYVKTHEIDSNDESMMPSTTSSTTPIITSQIEEDISQPIQVIGGYEDIANATLIKYFDDLKLDRKINNYKIVDLKILSKDELCSNLEYSEDKIYLFANISYDKIDGSFILDESEIQEGNNFVISSTFVLNKALEAEDVYEVESMNSEC